MTAAELCAQAASDLRARADAEDDPKVAEILRAVATSLDDGRADPTSASDYLFAAAADAAANPTRCDVLRAAAVAVSPSDDDRVAVGRLRAFRLAAFFGWEVTGYGYPAEGASFEDGGRRFRLCGVAMSALLGHVYATLQVAPRDRVAAAYYHYAQWTAEHAGDGEEETCWGEPRT